MLLRETSRQWAVLKVFFCDICWILLHVLISKMGKTMKNYTNEDIHFQSLFQLFPNSWFWSFCQDAQQRAFLAITLEASFRLHIVRFLEILDMISTNAQWVWCKCNFQFCFATFCNKWVQLVQLVLLGVCWCVPGRNGWISPATCWSRSAATQVQITWNR